MARWADDPEQAAHEVLIEAVSGFGPQSGQPILCATGYGATPAALAQLWAGHASSDVRALTPVAWWSRRVPAAAGHVKPEIGPWPAAIVGGYQMALLRLARTRAETRMMLDAAASVLAPDGRILVYGGNGEGIKSVASLLADGEQAETISRGGHGRVVEIRGTHAVKTTLSQWRNASTIALLPERPLAWIAYPGVFNDGELDAGTALLAGHFPPIATHGKVLDYGSGPGALSAAVALTVPSVALTLLEPDTVALAAAEENLAQLELAVQPKYLMATTLGPLAGQKFDLIVSNPPIHDGFREDHGVLDALIRGAPSHLVAGGMLALVVQRRLALDRQLSAAFASVTIAADNGRYRVWWAGKPKA